jgi:hypothetical protein
VPVTRDLWRGLAVFVVIGLGLFALDRSGLLDPKPGTAVSDPRAGRVVFGDSFDADFTIAGERTRADVGETTAWVAHARTLQPKDQPVVTVYLWDGAELTRWSTDTDVDWNLWGNTVAGQDLSEPGTLTVRVLTVGNEVLAEGSLVVE